MFRFKKIVGTFFLFCHCYSVYFTYNCTYYYSRAVYLLLYKLTLKPLAQTSAKMYIFFMYFLFNLALLFLFCIPISVLFHNLIFIYILCWSVAIRFFNTFSFLKVIYVRFVHSSEKDAEYQNNH